MRRMRVAQPMDGCGEIDASTLGCLLETMKLTARSVSGLPDRRMDWNPGADAGPRLANRRAGLPRGSTPHGPCYPCLRLRAARRAAAGGWPWLDHPNPADRQRTSSAANVGADKNSD